MKSPARGGALRGSINFSMGCHSPECRTSTVNFDGDFVRFVRRDVDRVDLRVLEAIEGMEPPLRRYGIRHQIPERVVNFRPQFVGQAIVFLLEARLPTYRLDRQASLGVP
jgi:hypothetical protein